MERISFNEAVQAAYRALEALRGHSEFSTTFTVKDGERLDDARFALWHRLQSSTPTAVKS